MTIRESNEEMLKAVVKEETIKNGESKKDYIRRVRNERKETWYKGELQGQFVQKTQEIADIMSWNWIKNGFLKKETEGMMFAAQEQALRTNAIKANIDKQPVSPLCRLCMKTPETVMHLASGCTKLAQKQYKKRHDNVAKEYTGNCVKSIRWNVQRNGTDMYPLKLLKMKK